MKKLSLKMKNSKKQFNMLKDNGSKLHIWGLLSNGGVHSSNEHIFGLLELANNKV